MTKDQIGLNYVLNKSFIFNPFFLRNYDCIDWLYHIRLFVALKLHLLIKYYRKLLVEPTSSYSSRWKHWGKIRCYMFAFKLKIHKNINIYILTVRRNLKIRAHTSVDAMTETRDETLPFSLIFKLVENIRYLW